jgi:hypothetical protein
MYTKRLFLVAVLILTLAVSLAPSISAQESGAKGTMNGTVVDSTGGSIAGAQVTVSGPVGSQNYTTGPAGLFLAQDLIPGTYSVRVEVKGFKVTQVSDIQINVGSVTAIRVVMEPGTVTQTVEVVSSAITVDTTTTAVATNLNDDFYQKLPVQRNVSGLFYLAPGAVSGGGTGSANPSISGGSGLENLYVADGVSITDTAFGGLGVFSRVYGSVGTGINLSFIKEVQVKTGAFQPQYGGATGGIVQIVTKSGGQNYHGAVAGFYQPQQFEAKRLNPDSFGLVNPVGDVLHNENADISFELGGPVPMLKDKLFFFGSFDPSETQTHQISPPGFGNFLLGEVDGRTLTYNYAGKLTYKFNDRNTLEGSVFGDPAHTNHFPWARLTQGPDGIPNTTNFSKLTFGNRDVVARYNATLSPTWILNISATWQHNEFKENGFDNSTQEIIDQTQVANLPGQQGQFTSVGRGFVENTKDNSYSGNINTTKIVNFWGQHSFDVGYAYSRAFYKGSRLSSGDVIPAPTQNMDGDNLPGASDWAGSPANYVWRLQPRPQLDAAGNFACFNCPLMDVPGLGRVPVTLRMFRSEFGLTNGSKDFSTHSVFHVGYVNDTWTINKYVTIDAGVRWQQERLVGANSQYTFTDDWSPRIGVSVDPIGDRKNKISFNFGRYSYNLPLDLAERSLTNELDLFSFRLAPDFTTGAGCTPLLGDSRCVVLNQFGTVTPVIDAAHTLNRAIGGISSTPFASKESGESIHSGTHSTYEDEYVIGAEHQFSHGVIASARYIHRSLRRIVEDSGGPSPEAALAGVTQQFSIANISKNQDIFENALPHPYFSAAGLPAACGPGDFNLFPVTNSLGTPVTDGQGHDAVCFEEKVTNDLGPVPIGVDGCQTDQFGNTIPGACPQAGSVQADGIPDGFADPVRRYWAVEFEVNKTFSHNWQLRANYRVAKLFGNFEGAFRNDNGQSDPGISSLFDFTTGDFNLLGNQFQPGILNTDRQQVANGYFSYVFDHGTLKNLTLGSGVRITTGTPINQMAAHPVYDNAGEVPIGGRGSEGRTPTTGQVDLHADYVKNITERLHLRFGVDMFNLGNAKRILLINQNIDLGTGTPNLDFLKPATLIATRGDSIQSPFNARVFFRLEF